MSSSTGCNEDIAGVLLTVVVAGAFREQISRIDERNLQASIWGVLALNVTYNVFYAFIDGTTFSDDQQYLFPHLYLGPAFCMALEFALLSYHTSYRALLLIIPSKKRMLWIAASVAAFVEFALHASEISMFELPGGATSQAQINLSITTATYNCVMETLLFGASQYRIIAVMREMNNAKVGVLVYADCVTRCILYSGTIFLFFMTAGGWFFDGTQGWAEVIFTTITFPMLLIILLTDCDRVRKLVLVMQKRTTSTQSDLMKQSMSRSRSESTSQKV
ncbi:hypothetical protein DFJ73DRAFT_863293 [Zopfochytrium polystomum]|nr:hypothetical protein DFJ73DRAFT_863293 [Zopfochytrium polystomum]